MAGHKRYRAGAWRITVEGPRDPITGERTQIHRTVHATHNREGAKAADLAIAKVLLEVEGQKIVPQSGLTVSQLLERYIVARSHKWSPREPDLARQRVRDHVDPHIGNIAAQRLRSIDVTQLYTLLRAKEDENGEPFLAESTVRKVHNLLHAALNWAWRHDLVPSNPAAKADKPGLGKGKRTAPADEVMLAILRAAEDDILCYLRLGAVTGARRGQLVALRWPDLDLIEGTVLFTRAHATTKGGVVEKGTKTDREYGIALDSHTVQLFRQHRVRCVERALAAGVALLDNGYVFARAETPDGSKAWYPDGANQRYNRVRRRVPGAKDVTPHQFRHWMATRMFEDGFDPITVAGRGGWASPTIPMTVYGHHSPPRDQAAAASLAKRLDS